MAAVSSGVEFRAAGSRDLELLSDGGHPAASSGLPALPGTSGFRELDAALRGVRLCYLDLTDGPAHGDRMAVLMPGLKWYCSKHLRLARLILPLVQEMRYVEIHEADMVAGAG